MDKIKLWLFFLRDFMVRNFMVSPKALLLNNLKLKYFKGFYYLFYLFIRILPFYFVKKIFGYFNISVIYLLDSIYNISNMENRIHIVPIILNFQVESESSINDLSSKIKYYSGNIPLAFILENNNIKKYSKIKIKYLTNGKIVDKVVDLDEHTIDSIKLYELFG